MHVSYTSDSCRPAERHRRSLQPALLQPPPAGGAGRAGGRLRPINPAATAHLVAVEYPTVGKAWLSLCGIAFNPAGIPPTLQRLRAAANRAPRTAGAIGGEHTNRQQVSNTGLVAAHA
jgi:hypothetical protein